MPNEIKQPVAFSFQDYRDEAIVDFFANESRSFQPDVSSSGRLRLVGSSRLEMRPTAAFRASISLSGGLGVVSGNVVETSAESIVSRPRGSKSASKLITKFPRANSFPKANTQLNSNAQHKSTDAIGVVSLIGDGGGDGNNNNNGGSASGEVSEWIEAALSKPTRSLASLSQGGGKIVGSGVGVGATGQVDLERAGKGIKVSNLELPAVVAPELQPVLPLRDRLSALKKTAARGGDTLKLVTLQVSEMEREVSGVVSGGVGEGIGLRVVSGESAEVPDLRVVEVDEQVDEAYQGQDSESCRGNVQSSIKFDPNLQKVVKAWAWLPERIKETIVSVVAVAEKDNE